MVVKGELLQLDDLLLGVTPSIVQIGILTLGDPRSGQAPLHPFVSLTFH